VYVDEDTGEFWFQGKTVTDPAALAEVATHSPIGANESVVKLPAVMAALMEVCIELASGMQVRMDHVMGDVPLLEIITGRARVIFGVAAGQARAIGPEHLAVAEEFASSAIALCDELRELAGKRI
jgi:hypothetical protein